MTRSVLGPPPAVTDVRPSADTVEPAAPVLAAFQEVLRLATRRPTDLDEILRLAGRRLCELLESNRCSVYLRQTDGTFRGQVGWSHDRDIDRSVRRLVSGITGDGFTAEIVATARPVHVLDAAKDPRTINRTMRRWSVQSMLGVPLVAEGEVIGVIYVDNERVARRYTDRDVEVAQAFAELSALVVKQSWQQRQLRENADVIERQRTVLSESSLIHSRVTRAVLDGAGIDEIIGLLAALLGQHVTLYGPDLTMVAWSAPGGAAEGPCPALTAEQAATEPVRTGVDRLRAGEPSYLVRATRELGHRRLMAGLMVDRQCVGYLELREGRSTFTQIHRRAVEQAAMALSLRTLSGQRSAALGRRERELFFADLLQGRDPKELADRAPSFGVDADAVHSVVVLVHQRGTGSERLAALREQGLPTTLVERALAPHSRVLSCSETPGADLLLVQTDPAACGPDGIDGLENRLVEALAEALPALRRALDVHTCVVSETCSRLLAVGEAARRSRQVTRILTQHNLGPRVVATREFGLLRLIAQRSGTPGALQYSEELFRPLTAHDAAHGGDLTRTLTTFVRCDAQLRRTAQELGVHENTVRYRLRKVREISDLCPDRLESLARVLLALQAGALRDADGEAAGVR